MQTFDIIFLAMTVAFTAACLITDLRWRRLPNWLTVPAFALAVVTHTVAHGLAGLQFSALGFATGFGLLLALYFIGGGGGGDVKMMAALGAWLGAVLTIKVFLATAVVTVMIAWGAMIYESVFPDRKAKREARRRTARGAADPATTRRKIPYAVPVALSTWLMLALALRHGSLLP